jgi:succinate dehydrogenase / fumarate reductase, flavoprotein subunit
MERYDPKRMELSTRDVVARSIYTEVAEGRGSPHGGAFLNISHKPADFIKKKLPSMYAQFMEFAHVDITKEPMEVYPTTHYMMGGIRVEAETAATNVPGLFAAGEAAAGLHGANRLGGNSLSDLVVFGRRAGAAAAFYALGLKARPEPDAVEVARAEQEMVHPFEVSEGDNPFDVQNDLQEMMMENVGVFRNVERLSRALERLGPLAYRAQHVRATGSRLYNPSWHTALDVKHMVLIAETIVRSALLRKESRGAHSRVDFPETNAELQRVNTISKLVDGQVRVEYAERPPLPPELAAIAEEKAQVPV